MNEFSSVTIVNEWDNDCDIFCFKITKKKLTSIQRRHLRNNEILLGFSIQFAAGLFLIARFYVALTEPIAIDVQNLNTETEFITLA